MNADPPTLAESPIVMPSPPVAVGPDDLGRQARSRNLQVGILTYHFSDNFGAVMQAYALRQWFLRRGCAAHFINYHPKHVEEGGDLIAPLNPRNWRRNLKILYLRWSFLRRRLFGDSAQRAHFVTFQERELGLSGPRLEHLEQLNQIGSSYDLLVCGSDQIWNPSLQRGLDPAYFLAFAASSRPRRISYAASFGKAALDEAFRDEAGRLLRGLDGISVREESGVAIVRDVCGREAACVPDPTILLGDFTALLAGVPAERGDHIFCYALRTGEGIREVADLVSARIGAPILSPYNAHRRWPEIGATVYPSPPSWLALLDSARVVVTNSFHGTALSVLRERPFMVVGLPGSRGAMNERVRNLLGQLDLTDRYVAAGDLASAERCLAAPIDWSSVRQKLARQRALGEAFLDRQLAEVARV